MTTNISTNELTDQPTNKMDCITSLEILGRAQRRPPGAASPTRKTTEVFEILLAAMPYSECPQKLYPRTTGRMELRQVTLNAHLERVNMRANNFLFVDQSSPTFFAQHGRGCCWSTVLPIFDSSIPSGDIRVQRRKLSEIAPNFGCFCPPKFLGQAFQKLYPLYHPCLTVRRLERNRKDIRVPTSPEVIGDHTLNFRPNYKFSRLKFFWGPRVPIEMCASKDWSICSACKNWVCSNP